MISERCKKTDIYYTSYHFAKYVCSHVVTYTTSKYKHSNSARHMITNLLYARDTSALKVSINMARISERKYRGIIQQVL